MIGTQIVNDFVTIAYMWMVLAVVLVFAIYDFLYKTIPNRYLLLFIPTAIMSIPISTFEFIPFHSIIIDALLGFLIGGGVILLSALITNGGIGGGDIKFCALLGLIYGKSGIVFVLLLASIFCAIIMILIKKYYMNKQSIAYAPFLFMACAIYTTLITFI